MEVQAQRGRDVAFLLKNCAPSTDYIIEVTNIDIDNTIVPMNYLLHYTDNYIKKLEVYINT